MTSDRQHTLARETSRETSQRAVLERIDATLTFYSAGLGEEVVVPVEKTLLAGFFAEFGEMLHAAVGALFEGLSEGIRGLAVFMSTPEMQRLTAALTDADNRRRRHVYRRWNDPLLAADRMDWYRQQVEVGRWTSRTIPPASLDARPDGGASDRRGMSARETSLRETSGRTIGGAR